MNGKRTMRLTVWLPSQVLMRKEVTRIRAEAENGWFGLLPRHIDFVTALVPGILRFKIQKSTTETRGHGERTGSGNAGGSLDFPDGTQTPSNTAGPEDTEDRTRDSGTEVEEYLAIDYGILVKHGADVSISTRTAVHSRDLEQLKKDLQAQFSMQEEREKAARTYEVRLETDLVRRLLELEKHG